MLLSTIDKFARIVWEDRTSRLFGSDGVVLPPELIIQDELHLISGPLGSISGLYETAIDELCSIGNKVPKIIASTATVRNAKNQIKALYDRASFQFPPSGIDLNNNFFAVRANKNLRPARRYVGICETGGSLMDIMVRLYGCLFFILNYFEAIGMDEKIIDQYWTIVGYFNSLKDLGSSSTVILERVILYAESLRLHKFRDLAKQTNMTKIVINGYDELTSRKSAKEIKDNKNLALALKPHENDMLSIQHFHGLAANYVNITGESDEYFNNILPEALFNILSSGRIVKYDVLIIDEAQDLLKPSIILCLNELVDGGISSGK